MNTTTQPATPITEAGIYPPSRTSNGPLLVRASVARNLELSRADLLAALDEIEDASGELMSRVEYDGLTVDQIASYLVEIQNQARAAISRAKGQA